jgi:hypothetical protein
VAPLRVKSRHFRPVRLISAYTLTAAQERKFWATLDLAIIKKRRNGDIGFENCRSESGPPVEGRTRRRYKSLWGGGDEVEKALLAVFQATNKGLAHVTENFIDNPEHGTLVEIASCGFRRLSSAISTRRSDLQHQIINSKVDFVTIRGAGLWGVDGA